MRPRQEIEVFNDGYIEVYREEQRKLTEKKGKLPYQKQSVGVNRFYQANLAVDGNRVDKLIKVPMNGFVSRMDVIIIKGEEKQYRINRIQEKPERGSLLLELQSVNVAVQIREENHES